MKKSTRIKREIIEGKYLVNSKKRRKKFREKIHKSIVDFFQVKMKSFFDNRRQNIDKRIGKFARKLYYKRVEVVPNRLFFSTFNGVYNCNQKYITKELLKQDVPVEIYWGVTKDQIKKRKKEGIPEEVNLVERYTFQYFKALASSKFWFDNALSCVWKYIPKKKNQIYIETWHGSMGLKKISKEDITDEHWLKKAKLCGKLVDYCISNSTFETQVFRETHFPKNEILEFGHARNDILFDETDKAELKEKIFKRYNLSIAKGTLVDSVQDTHVCLYAPTFRDDKSFDYFDMKFPKILEALREKYGGEWKLFTRFHFKDRRRNYKKTKNVVNVTSYSDIQELMLIADVGITDYSSWICDFVLTGKPGLIYATDFEKYNSSRGLYYPLEETPFPIATNNDELIENILNFDDDEYQKKREEFLTARGCKEDGHAAERIVELVKELM